MYMYVCSQVHTILNEVCRAVIPVYTNRDVMMLRRLSACQIVLMLPWTFNSCRCLDTIQVCVCPVRRLVMV